MKFAIYMFLIILLGIISAIALGFGLFKADMLIFGVGILLAIAGLLIYFDLKSSMKDPFKY